MTNQRQPTDGTSGPERVLGAQARAYREKLGMTQDEVAEAMTVRGFKMGQSTITKIENAQRPVRVNEAVALAAVLHADLADLIADPAQRGRRDALAAAQDEERVLAGQLRQAERKREGARSALSAAEEDMHIALSQVAAIQARHAEAKKKAEALAAAAGDGESD